MLIPRPGSSSGIRGTNKTLHLGQAGDPIGYSRRHSGQKTESLVPSVSMSAYPFHLVGVFYELNSYEIPSEKDFLIFPTRRFALQKSLQNVRL
jgi:hypothetical protein